MPWEYLDYATRLRMYYSPPPPLPVLLRDLTCRDVEIKARKARGPGRPPPRKAVPIRIIGRRRR